MPRARLIYDLLLVILLGAGASVAGAQSPAKPLQQPDTSGAGKTVTIDGIAARIEDDIITESDVSELAAFQELVEGHAKSHDEIIGELADQWIVRQEASAVSYGQPTQEEIDRASQQLVKQFGSAEEFRSRCAALGLTDAAIRRLLTQQLYLSRFLDQRFRPAAQVTPEQVEAYYQREFAPQLKARNEEVPALDEVEDTIREVLIQRAITERAEKWLDDTRSRLKIEIVSHGASS